MGRDNHMVWGRAAWRPRPGRRRFPRMSDKQPEVWLRGPVPGVPALLQPAAHALLQAKEDVARLLPGLRSEALGARPGGAASIAYHVRHAAGSLDRLYTYARGSELSSEQRATLVAEARLSEEPVPAQELVALFEAAVDRALTQLRETPEESLLEAREVGRKKLPATVLGLLFHGAEHTVRHAGQVATTVKVQTGGDGAAPA